MKVQPPFRFLRVRKYRTYRTKWTGGSGPELHRAGWKWVFAVLKGTRYFYGRGA